MPYYQGDYYQGSIFSGIGKLAKKVAGGVFKRTPVGVALDLIPKFGTTVMPAAQIPPIDVPRGFPGSRPTPGIGGHVSRIFPFGMSGYEYQSCDVKGTHRNKSTYITRGGGTSRWPSELMVHEKGTECVKSRRMNVCNPRALRRGLRRAQGFAKIARRVLAATHHFEKAGGRRKK